MENRASRQGLISPDQVPARHSDSRIVDLIDVRTPIEYAEVHAKGARLFPLDTLDPRAIMAARNGAADDPIYVICKSGTRAAKAVEKFHAAGFSNAICVDGGTTAWEQAGLPVVRGITVIPLERQVRIGAGTLVLLGLALGWLVHPAFFGLSAFIGSGLVFSGMTGWCGMAMILARMPWNTRACLH